MMDTPLIQQAAHANRQGAYWLSYGDISKAIGNFQESLDILEQHHAETQLQNSQNQKSSTSSDNAAARTASSRTSLSRRSVRQFKYGLNTTKGINLEDDNFYIHNRPIIFYPPSYSPLTASMDDSVSCPEIILCTVTTTFNLALSYHQQGNKKINNADVKLLNKAIDLYDRCYIIMENASESLQSYRNLIFAALLNNKAQIYNRLSNSKKAVEALQDLANIVNELQDNSNSVVKKSIKELSLDRVVFSQRTSYSASTA